MVWCDRCGDVAYVCDSPECDTHLREDELETMISLAERGIREDAAKCREFELVLRNARNLGVETYQTANRNKVFGNKEFPGRHEVNKARSLVESIRFSEKELLEVEERLAALRFCRSKGCVMVPR
jgi:hypothetical protein